MQKETLRHRLYRIFVQAQFQGKEPVYILGGVIYNTPANYRGTGKFGRLWTIGVQLLFMIAILFALLFVVTTLLPAAFSQDPKYGFDTTPSWLPDAIIAGLVLFSIIWLYLLAGLRWMISNYKATI